MKTIVLLSTLALGLIVATESFAQTVDTGRVPPGDKQHLRLVLIETSVVSKSGSGLPRRE
jgi:hypothetical protein